MTKNQTGLTGPKTKSIRVSAKTDSRSVAVAAIAQATSTITVLRAQGAVTRKVYYLDSERQLKVIPYSNALMFRWERVQVSDITTLAAEVQGLSKESNAILIRGTPVGIQTNPTYRRKTNFAEPDEGCRWVMLDFDGIAVPEGTSSIDPIAIEALIQKLPPEFQGVSYFYQFSSSAGILKADGSPLKAGVSAHVFFWPNRPVHGKDIGAWLRLHCIETGFLDRTFDSGGSPWVRYGIDEAVLRTAHQPHYVALPEIRDGVECILAPKHRQGLVEKALHAVPVPGIDPGMRAQAAAEHARLRDEWKRECGFVPRRLLTKVRGGGVSVDTYYGRPASGTPATGRAFVKAEVTEGTATPDRPAVSFARLYFEDENSPGSWWVSSSRPTLARRYGDDEAVPLKELSEGAHAHVRDVLQWFEDMAHRELSLTAEGFLPGFNTFVRARNTLILAPTGSGKTTVFCDYALQRCRTDIIVYAAQTIALTNQMMQDLGQRQVPAHHYQSFNEWFKDMDPGVYVTTNVSLHKFVEHLQKQGANFTLVIDEAHLGIDDFMQSERRNKELDLALARATKTILMTGTITELQIRKITECITHATGSLMSQNFEFCEFKPTRARPLFWASEPQLGADLAALMRSHQALKAAGQPIPRTVLIVPTSSMRIYELLLEQFGLADDAMVVSRTETTQEDIEAARVSDKPWLISSPLFAIGLNFVIPPVRFWTNFGRLQVDKSQIVQTVNRANRTEVECEVRLYAGRLDATPFPYLVAQEERDTIEDYLQGEAETPGVIDARYQLDRLTYLELRDKQEKDTAKALYQLKLNSDIQNYTIVEDWQEDLVKDPDDADLFKEGRSGARASYKQDVAARYAFYGDENTALLLHYLKQTHDQARHAAQQGLVPKQVEDDRRALLAKITGNRNHVKHSGGADLRTILRLFAVELPSLTGQYNTDKTEAWRPATAEKVRAIIKVLGAMEDLRAGKIDGTGFGLKMRQEGLREGVLALAKSEPDYLKLSRDLDKLEELYEARIKASVQARPKLDQVFFKAAQEFLARVGVEFETTGSGRSRSLDPKKPVVPNWDYARMKLALEVLAESVESRPEKNPDTLIGALKFSGVAVSLKLCTTCAHYSIFTQCVHGFPIEWPENGIEPFQDNCPEFKQISVRVQRMKERINRQ